MPLAAIAINQLTPATTAPRIACNMTCSNDVGGNAP